MATRDTEGRREIEAAKQRLSAAKSHDNFISKTLVSAKTAEDTARKMLATAKKNREDIEAQAKSSNKEVSDAQKFLAEVEARWEVIAIDIDDDMSKKNDKERCKKFLVAVTGFHDDDANRYRVKSMANEIGVDWSDDLSRRNTHLVCEKAEGQKYNKALEWGIHVVSIEWLHHIVKYGYEEGSEDKFSLNNTQKQTDTKESGKKRKAAAAVSPQSNKNNNTQKEDSQVDYESDAAVLNGYPNIKDVESWNRIYVAADR